MNFMRTALTALLEYAYPEECGLCGTSPAGSCWTKRGTMVRTLRWWDRTQLCLACLDGIRSDGTKVRPAAEGRPTVWAGAVASPTLVEAVGLLKYHGLRGVAWPLAELLEDSLGDWNIEPVLVPVALHRRRQRERGFNQAEVLARLVATLRGWEVDTGILKRRKATAQQARITDDSIRRINLTGAFEARPVGPGEGGQPLVLVDDLVTSGATVEAATTSLRAAGWVVEGVLALGLAAGIRKDVGPVDRGDGGF